MRKVMIDVILAAVCLLFLLASAHTFEAIPVRAQTVIGVLAFGAVMWILRVIEDLLRAAWRRFRAGMREQPPAS